VDLDKIPVGANVPDSVNVIIEIPAHSSPVKYEFDKETGSLMVDRFMAAQMFYPANYGFIPHTLADDGDPIDVLVVTPHPLIHGCVIKARPVGVLNMHDEAGEDAKIVAVPGGKLYPDYDAIQSYGDLPRVMIQQIEHFFEYYKKLEPGKWVEVKSWGNAHAAKEMILASIKAHDDAKK
jgi:inorganic pyrophosphatase